MRTRLEAQVEFTWLTPREFGKRAAGVSPDTVKKSIRLGEIPSKWVQKTRGGFYRINPQALDWWLEKHAA